MRETIATRQDTITIARRAPYANRLLSSLRDAPLFPVIILSVVTFVGIFGALIAPYDPIEHDLTRRLLPPFWQPGGDMRNLLGTDHMGRDILSRLIAGARISLVVGVTVVFFAGSIGAIVAVVSGYMGGWVDIILMRLTDAMLSMPFLVVAIALAGALGPSEFNMILVLAVMGWASYARVLRGEVLRVKQGDFIKLAVIAGSSNARILIKHVFPNIVNTLVVLATLQLGGTIIAAASLSFLGLGIPPPAPAWGSMLAEGRQYVASAWWLALFPGLAIMFTVLGANLLGDWLRVRLDPKFRQL